MTQTNLLATLLLLSLGGCAAGGAPAPAAEPAALELQLTDMQGTRHDLDAELASGRSVALVFWQTWCESCEREAPAIAEAARAFGDRITFVGVVPGRPGTVDDDEVRQISQDWGYDRFPQVRDPELALTHALHVDGTPTLIVLGPDRRERFRGHQAPSSWGQYADGPPSSECAGGVCPLPTD